MGLLDGKVVLITGAGRGIGRECALISAREGARVVVNDLGGGIDGEGRDTGPAEDVAQEIRAAGGEERAILVDRMLPRLEPVQSAAANVHAAAQPSLLERRDLRQERGLRICD